MIRGRFVTLTVALTLATAGFASQHPNLVKGFQANGVYQSNGVDNINAFNGNLTLTIPIGPAFNIGGGLSYQLRLYSNGNVWDAEERVDMDGVVNGACVDAHIVPCMHAFPDRRANAGIGWTLSLGRLFPPAGSWQSTNDDAQWVYESPDGAEHRFSPTPIGPNTAEAGVWYNHESKLRLRQAGATYKVDLPNGEVHTFIPNDDPGTTSDDDAALIAPWLLQSITNQFAANQLTIDYRRPTLGAPIDRWTLDDGFRTQIVHFAAKPFESGAIDADSLINERMLVTQIDIAAFGDDEAVGSYVLSYQQPPSPGLIRPDWHNIRTTYVSRYATVQWLTKITLPDGTFYDVNYVGGTLPRTLTLPTGGRIEWTWRQYAFPYVAADSRTYARYADGVATRKVFDRGGTVPVGTWTYTPASAGSNALVTTIEDPKGSRNKQYFNAYALPYTDPPAPAPDDYAKPFTSHQSIVGPGGNVFLSEEFIAAGATTPARATYLRYDSSYKAVVASRNLYHDDGNAYLDTERTNDNGYGHYRTVVTSGPGVPTRTTTTNYRGSAISSIQPWLMGLFDFTTATESGIVLRSEYDFAPTGFLQRKRVVKNTVTGSPSAQDIIGVYTADTRGNVASEEYYGGDGGGVGTGPLATATLGQRQYRLVHVRDGNFGVLRSSSYEKAGQPTVVVVDQDADRTGLIKESRDSAGLITTYEYDAMGRLTWAKPPGRAATHYSYPNFSSTYEITAEQFPHGATSGATLTEARYLIDGLGRTTRELTRTAAPTATTPAKYSRRDTSYNALGWQERVSELVDSAAATAPATVFTHDAFGRIMSATAPDNSETTFSYTGVRSKTRTSKVSTTPSTTDVAVAVTESYDLYGRLTSVTEGSGPTHAGAPLGPQVTTRYGYGPGGQLLSVKMTGAEGAAQDRIFDYDGRGFLRWESHPESGMTTYTYDARGNVLTKHQSAAQSLFDLEYTYDHAERLVTVKGRNPFSDTAGQPQWRVLKTFTYADENVLAPAPADYRKGKLLTAARYNYDPAAPSPSLTSDFVYKVAETYQYRDTAGRKTNRRTRITRGTDPNEALWWTYREVDTAIGYDDLDLIASIDYPFCVGCAYPARRLQTFTYDQGRLKTVPGFVSNVTYHPNLMWNVISHSNGVNDTQEPDPSGMARPYRIKAALSNSCPVPKIMVQPVGRRLTASAPSVTLSVGLSTDTGTVSHQWTNVETGAVVSTQPTYTAAPSVTTSYSVTITNECHTVVSDVALVSVNECILPGGDELVTWNDRNPDGTYTLRTSNAGTQPLTYTWTRSSDGATLGTSRTITIAAPPVTTIYSVTAINECGTRTGSTTVVPPPTMASTGVEATWNGGNVVTVSWPAAPGAAQYRVERRSGSEWTVVATRTTTDYPDQEIVMGRSYAYRVQAGDSTGGEWSSFSNAAVATTRTFTQVSSGSTITAASVAPMLESVNSVRGAVGWPAVTWTEILSTRDRSPAPTSIVLASHILTCRARMNEALQALGVPTSGYTDAALQGIPLKALHINQVTGRAQ